VPAEVRLYERLFAAAQPGAGDVQDELNPSSLVVTQAYAEPALAKASPGQAFQFERHGYFVPDSRQGAGAGLVFNRAAGMKDSWGK
jgi:glutaminyl-tRNA synthetase